ncbi:MAG: hypothetical protein AB8G17_17500 [Gammaproteobacteria bacterium]
MMNSGFRYALLLVALPWLGACGSTASCDKPEPFESATEGGSIKVPGDLSAPTPSGKFSVPPATSDKQARGPCGDVPPLRAVVSAPEPESDAESAAESVAAAAGGVPLPLPTTEVDPLPLPLPGGVGGPPKVAGGIEVDVRDMVIAWIKAWRAADGGSLAQFYAAEFEPSLPGDTRQAWLEKRVALLSQSGPADVRYDLLKVSETFAGASARFIQEFHNDGRIDAVVKELDLVVEDERWKIVRERVVEVL